MTDLHRDELHILRSLTTPQKIQDYLGKIPINFEKDCETCLSPRRVLREKRAHCMEGAMLAALALRMIGYRPLVVDLKALPNDDDHVIAVYKERGYWGAISKSNHNVLRYRDPIYRSVRELALSFFHEYFLDNGQKTLRSFSIPVDLSRFDARGWVTAEEDLWYIPRFIDRVRHFPMLTRSQAFHLRNADPLERKLGKVLEWQPPVEADTASHLHR